MLLGTVFRPALCTAAAAAALTLALATSLDARPVAGQQPATSVTVHQVDASAYPDLTAVVTVLDAAGSPAVGLPPAAFTARDGEAAVEVVGVERVLNASLSLGVVLVIDVSGSMQGGPLASAKEAASAFVQQLDPGDRATVLAFSDTVRTVVPFTDDRNALIAGIGGLQAAGDTSLYEAVGASAVAAGGSLTPRSAIVILSDGENTITSSVSEAASLDAVRNVRVPVYAIGYGPGADPAYLGRLADTTGGRFLAAAQTDVAAVYAAIAEQLRGQYVLSLRSPVAEDGADASLVVIVDVAGQPVTSAPFRFVRGEAPPPAPTQPPPPPQAAADEDGGSSLLIVVVVVIAATVVVAAAVAFLARMLRARRTQRARERHAGRQSDAPLPPPLPSPPSVPVPESFARIVALTGERAGESVQFGSVPIVIGSDPNADVQLAASRDVAPRHAQLWVREGKIMLRHLGGRKKTMAMGRAVEWLILDEGDEFSVGPHSYRVEAASGNGTRAMAGAPRAEH